MWAPCIAIVQVDGFLWLQAWCEASVAHSTALDSEVDTGLDDWLALDSISHIDSGILHGQDPRQDLPSLPPKHKVPLSPDHSLDTVAEASDEETLFALGLPSQLSALAPTDSGAGALVHEQGTSQSSSTLPGLGAADLEQALPIHISKDAWEKKPQQVLYIQMEFCPRTLRQVLDDGPMPEADAWQVRFNFVATFIFVRPSMRRDTD